MTYMTYDETEKLADFAVDFLKLKKKENRGRVWWLPIRPFSVREHNFFHTPFKSRILMLLGFLELMKRGIKWENSSPLPQFVFHYTTYIHPNESRRIEVHHYNRYAAFWLAAQEAMKL